MGKYRHAVTGIVGHYDDEYARAVKALEPVDEDTPVDSLPCDDCGPRVTDNEVTAGVVLSEFSDGNTEPDVSDEGE